MKISVCIPSYRRPERLAALLNDLEHQDLRPDEVVVVDNDAAGSAREVVEQRRAHGCSFSLLYDIQPKRNIALTRNRTVQLAHGEWLAFVDDDERAPPAWLGQLVAAAERYNADGVLAPVEPQVPDSAPAWIRRGKFYDWAHAPSGTVVPHSMLRFGNVLLRGASLRAEPGPFDVSFGLAAGEDHDVLRRLIARGARIVWCDEAIVWEPIETRRLSLRWLLHRALSGGQSFARVSIANDSGTVNVSRRSMMLLRWVAQLVLAVVLAALSWPIGRHRAAGWLLKASANLGKLSVFFRWRYRDYA